jgi:hypothetical protein
MRELRRRADLARDDIGHLVVTRDIRFEHALEQRNAFFHMRLRERYERAPRRGHRAIDIACIAERDFADHFFRRWIDDRQTRAAERLDPFAVDIKLL